MSNDKDKMFNASSAKFGENSKGNGRVQFYLSKEDAEAFATEVVLKSEEGAGTGVLIDIHESVGQSKQTGKTIKGAFAFVKAKQAQNQERTTQKEYKPKTQQESVVDRLKRKQVE